MNEDEIILLTRQFNKLNTKNIEKIIDNDFKQLSKMYIKILENPTDFTFILDCDNLDLYIDSIKIINEFLFNNDYKKILIEYIKRENQKILIEDDIIDGLLDEYINFLQK